VKGDMERKLEVMKGWLEEQREDQWTLIGGDFNARTGSLGGGKGGGEEEETGRRSKNGKTNSEGRKLVGELEKVGWGIMNGGQKGTK